MHGCWFLCSRLSDLATLYDGGGGGGGGGTISENGLDAVTTEAYERRIQKAERENKELARKLQGQFSYTSPFLYSDQKNGCCGEVTPRSSRVSFLFRSDAVAAVRRDSERGARVAGAGARGGGAASARREHQPQGQALRCGACAVVNHHLLLFCGT